MAGHGDDLELEVLVEADVVLVESEPLGVEHVLGAVAVGADIGGEHHEVRFARVE